MHMLFVLAIAVTLVAWLPGAAWLHSWGRWLSPLGTAPAVLLFSMFWLLATGLLLLAYMLIARTTPGTGVLVTTQLLLGIPALTPGILRIYRHKPYLPLIKKVGNLLGKQVGDSHGDG
jgi:hypothetical protein